MTTLAPDTLFTLDGVDELANNVPQVVDAFDP